MMMTRRRILSRVAFLAGASAIAPLPSMASDWPSKSITATVGFKPGGGSDVTARLFAPQLKTRLGAPRISVRNMPGASGGVAANHVYSQLPNGNSWLFSAGYDRGLRAMGFSEHTPYLDWQYFGADNSLMSLSVRTDSPIRDMEDMLRIGHDQVETITISVGGYGGSWHLAILLVMRATGARFRIIPYEGGHPATVAGLNGEVDVVCSGLHEQIPFIKRGQFRHLATGAAKIISLEGLKLISITEAIPILSSHTPIGGGSAMALHRGTDPGVLKLVSAAWSETVTSRETLKVNLVRGRFASLVTGEEADRRAALFETQASNLLYEAGIAKHSPRDLGLPSIEEFENWWPPHGYRVRI